MIYLGLVGYTKLEESEAANIRDTRSRLKRLNLREFHVFSLMGPTNQPIRILGITVVGFTPE
jgi:hypothetical protein